MRREMAGREHYDYLIEEPFVGGHLVRQAPETIKLALDLYAYELITKDGEICAYTFMCERELAR